MAYLGVNIDHVATVRQARRESDPDPILAMQLCEKNGAKSIVAHLREDRRHIQDRDIILLKKLVRTRFNLEMSVSPSIVSMACELLPDQVTLVPERRQEITTEGGLDVTRHRKRISDANKALTKKGIEVSLFIAPTKKQIDATLSLGIKTVEFHTGHYAQAFMVGEAKIHLFELKRAIDYANAKGMTVNVGHGLNYDNVRPLLALKGIQEFNIGHAIVSRAIFVGLGKAVKEMVRLINGR